MERVVLEYNIHNLEYLNSDVRKYVKDINKLYDILNKIWEYMKNVLSFLIEELHKEVDKHDTYDIMRKEHKTRIKNMVEKLMLNYIQYLIVNNIYLDAPENLIIDYIREIELEENINMPSFEELVNNQKVYSVIYYSINGILTAMENYRSIYKPISIPNIFRVEFELYLE